MNYLHKAYILAISKCKIIKLNLANTKEVNIAKNCFLEKSCSIKCDKNSRLVVGSNTSISRNCYISVVNNGNMNIGRNVFFNSSVIAVCRNNIKIEDNVMFGPNVVIYDHDHYFNNKEIKKNDYITGNVVIGKNCWIGANVTILRNTYIGEGSIIGAGTVVKGNIPGHSIVTNSGGLKIRAIEEKNENTNV